MTAIAYAASLLLATMFASAAILHLRTPDHMAAVLQRWNLAPWLVVPFASVEATLAVGMLLATQAAILALTYVAVVTVPTLARAIRGESADPQPCGCYAGPFGQVAGRRLLLRNAVIALLALFVSIFGTNPTTGGDIIVTASVGAAALVASVLRYLASIPLRDDVGEDEPVPTSSPA